MCGINSRFAFKAEAAATQTRCIERLSGCRTWRKGISSMCYYPCLACSRGFRLLRLQSRRFYRFGKTGSASAVTADVSGVEARTGPRVARAITEIMASKLGVGAPAVVAAPLSAVSNRCIPKVKQNAKYAEGIVRISSRAKLGQHLRIYDDVIIMDGVEIGDNCIIEPGAIIYENVNWRQLLCWCSMHFGRTSGCL